MANCAANGAFPASARRSAAAAVRGQNPPAEPARTSASIAISALQPAPRFALLIAPIPLIRRFIRSEAYHFLLPTSPLCCASFARHLRILSLAEGGLGSASVRRVLV